MKRIFFILGLFLIVFGLKAQSNNPSSLSDIVTSLQSKFDVSISYDGDLQTSYTEQEQQNILSKNTIEEALSEMTSKKDLTYKKLRVDYFVITKKPTSTFNANPVITNETLQKIITGVVYDSSGVTLVGATIVEKGTNNVAVTDIYGKFQITVSDDATTLVVSFTGMDDYEITLTNETHYEIYLAPSSVDLGVIVVSGVAGETPTKKLTVTVNHLDADQLDNAPAGDAASALQGKIPGATIVSASGQPGSGSTIRLRGVTSMLGNNAPLIIVDGVMVQTSLADFNADDIESIEVVKGAAASALYGSKAAGGVVVINTKRGKNQKKSFEITVRNEFGTSQLSKQIQLSSHHPYQLDSAYQDYSYTRYAGVEYDDDGNVISGSRILNDSGYCDQPYATLRNHQQNFFKSGNYYTNYVGIGSKSSNTNFYLSFENHHNEGIIFNTQGYSRKNFRFNADTKIGNRIKLSTSNLFINSFSDKPGSDNSFFDLLFINPDIDLTADNEDGTPYRILPDPWSIEENPLYPLHYRQRQTTKNVFMSNIKGSLFVTDWLTLDAKYSLEKQNIYYNTYTPKGYLYGGEATIGGSIFMEEYTANNQVFQTTANFKKTFGDFLVKSKLSYMYEDETYNDFAVTGRNFLVPGNSQLTNTDPASSSLSSYDGAIRAIDIFGIVDFDYKSKYLFSGLLRRDGSSLFGINEKWQNYFRIAGAYRITEDFTIPGIQELKIRTAYGTSGLRPGFSWQYETFYFSSGYIVRGHIGNKNLRPAEARELEFALDAQFLNRFNFTASYSETNTIGAFAEIPLASHLGAPYQWRNVGDIKSDVIELSLGFNAIDNDNVNLHFQVNFDKIHQEMVNLTIPAFYTGPHSAYFVNPGEEFGVLYGYDWVRDLETMAKQLPEDMTISDYAINSDGYVILAGTEGSTLEAPIPLDTNYIPGDANNTPDKVLIGNGNSNFNLNFSTNFTVKGFTIYFLVDWKNGGDVYNYTHQYTFRDARAIEFDQFAKPEDQKKSINYYNTFYQQSINSYFIEDGSYVKLRELSVYYTLTPKNLNGFVKSVRLGVAGRNLYTFTGYSGYDPEVASSGDLSTFAFDNFGYPNFRTISASLQLKF